MTKKHQQPIQPDWNKELKATLLLLAFIIIVVGILFIFKHEVIISGIIKMSKGWIVN